MGCRVSLTRQVSALPPYGINRNRLDDLLRDLGGAIRHLRRTGEVAYSHPALSERPRANSRRKDASMHLVRFVRRVILAGDLSLIDNQGARSRRGTQP